MKIVQEGSIATMVHAYPPDAPMTLNVAIRLVCVLARRLNLQIASVVQLC